MRITRSHKLRLALFLAALAALGVSAMALANVTIYSNSFSSQAQYNQIRKAGGGKACGRSYREAAKKVRVIVNSGDTLCQLRPPVAGDSDLPDHDVRVQGKFLKKKTPKSQRKGAYIAVAVRAGEGERYELSVKPKAKKWFLNRSPKGSGFPKHGKLKQIKPLDRMNTLRLRAFGTRIRAFVNGKKVASMRENDPGEVSGRRILFGLGNSRPAKKSIQGLMDNLRVQVPVP
jgi:hypothetical protein